MKVLGKIETGDLLFCHAIGNKYAWFVNQIGVVGESNKRKTRFKVYLSSGKFSEVTQVDLEKGNVEIVAKANGSKIALNEKIRKIPGLPNSATI
tara:strand:+ start:8 stop:289 length:282 start_codon:yes stop_codon:yes gene_type:complete